MSSLSGLHAKLHFCHCTHCFIPLLKSPIAITGFASLSPLGHDETQIWQHYLSPSTCIQSGNYSGRDYYCAALPSSSMNKIAAIAAESRRYQQLDPAVLYALFVARRALAQTCWLDESQSMHAAELGINFGSSRGATQSFERYHQEFLEQGRANKISSPATTLGNMSSWVAQDLKVQGPVISHSVTCSTGLHALLNGVAWLLSGLSSRFMVGASEAALSAFTLSQMEVLKITALADSEHQPEYPCRALDLDKSANSMALGEGAAAACLQVGYHEKALAYILGLGFATDESEHNTGISADAICFQRSMHQALQGVALHEVDVIVMHAPGTMLGDSAEYRAIQAVFGTQLPALTSNKWKIGHSLGAAGMLSLELALLMLRHQHFVPVPYLPNSGLNDAASRSIRKVLINAVGFGGNAVSLLVGAL